MAKWVQSPAIPLTLKDMVRKPEDLIAQYLDELVKQLPNADVFQIRVGVSEYGGRHG